ncbi:MAG: site-2 protease family protein [Pyrinomonadaceae bacterium]|nr:site-2 protease family protein [Pyrinomonadaceae bacterium]
MSELLKAPHYDNDAQLFFIEHLETHSRPTAREWRKHIALFLLTLLTTTLAGIVLATAELPEPDLAAPATWMDEALRFPVYYLRTTSLVIANAFAHPTILWQGVAFSVSLVAILLAHEAGHYIACRCYGMRATLPFFIPAPPLFLAGTFGAFIKIKSPVPSRRALFDVAVAGPLAGFAVILPVALLGFLTAQPAPPFPPDQTGVIIFNDPLLLRLFARALNVNTELLAPNSFYFAAWIGLVVTSLNLIPVGQLDGGHAIYSALGKLTHKWSGYAAFIVMCALAALGWHWHNAPSGFLYVVLLAVILRFRHPRVIDEAQNLGGERAIIAFLTLVVFVLSFWPFPVTIR